VGDPGESEKRARQSFLNDDLDIKPSSSGLNEKCCGNGARAAGHPCHGVGRRANLSQRSGSARRSKLATTFSGSPCRSTQKTSLPPLRTLLGRQKLQLPTRALRLLLNSSPLQTITRLLKDLPNPILESHQCTAPPVIQTTVTQNRIVLAWLYYHLGSP
jgi:hypothetical protein